MYKRLILKLSGEALCKVGTSTFNDDVILNIINQVKNIIANKTEISIIVGGGNFWRGRDSRELDRTKSDQIGMLSTIMNAIYLSDKFRQNNIEAIIMTPFEVGTMSERFSKRIALNYLKEGKIIIFAGGIGHPFFSTDTVTALRACELDADAILFAKNIDGVYDKDPSKFDDAKKFSHISCKEIMEKNLKVIDISAASLCYENKIPVVIFGLLEENSIIKATNKENVGTIVTI